MLMVPLLLIATPTARAEPPRPIELSSLPEPPPEIADWIRRWKVKLTTGEHPADHPVNLRRLAANTEYQIAFNYRRQSRWRHDRQAGTVRIQISLPRIQWQPTHTIWFRNPPKAEEFWDDRLVRHEFDHVQISGDPRVEKQFRELLKSNSVIRPTIEPGQTVNQALVEKLVDEHVQQLFQKTLQLIDVRYQELDRVTSQGRREIPEDSIVQQWLQEDAEEK